jgi:hypothetical protein
MPPFAAACRFRAASMYRAASVLVLRTRSDEARIRLMETLVARSEQSNPEQSRRRAFAHGASSAFDISGLATFHDEVFRPRRPMWIDPAGMISLDMARIMDTFGRSAARARSALRAGTAIEHLDPGWTLRGAVPGSSKAPPRDTRPSRGLGHKNIA